MSRVVCAVCGLKIEKHQQYYICKICKRHYHIGHRCPEHPDSYYPSPPITPVAPRETIPPPPVTIPTRPERTWSVFRTKFTVSSLIIGMICGYVVYNLYSLSNIKMYVAQTTALLALLLSVIAVNKHTHQVGENHGNWGCGTFIVGGIILAILTYFAPSILSIVAWALVYGCLAYLVSIPVYNAMRRGHLVMITVLTGSLILFIPIFIIAGLVPSSRVLLTKLYPPKTATNKLSTQYDFAQYLKLGENNFEHERYEEAISDYTKAIELNPTSALAYHNRAYAYRNKQDYDNAIADYSQALQLDAHVCKCIYNARGVAYLYKGVFDKAITDFTKAIEVNPHDGKIYQNRGNAYLALNVYENAIVDYTKALELAPTESKSLYSSRGKAYRRKGDYENAIVDYTKVIELYPQEAIFYHDRGHTYQDKEDYENAIADYTKALELDPKVCECLYSSRGALYRKKGDLDQAIADYTKAIELYPQEAIFYHDRGHIFQDKENYENAISDYTKALELNPSVCTCLYDARGKAYDKLGKIEEATADFSRATAMKTAIHPTTTTHN
jgi:tetratricopeptide (TPR) repeat protein/uncharacterized membrane protein